MTIMRGVAVLPYQRSAGLHAILRDAVNRLTTRGVQVAGLLQRTGGKLPSGKFSMWVDDISSGQAVRLDQPRGSGATACTFDTDALAQATYLLRLAIDSGADVIFVNRFGNAEAEGGGLRADIAEAICRGILVLIPVQTSRLDDLEAFLGGSATPLEPSAAAITDCAEQAGTLVLSAGELS